MSEIQELRGLVEALAADNERLRMGVGGDAPGSTAAELVRTSAAGLLEAVRSRLRESHHLRQNIFDGALDAMLLADEDGRYVDANPAACTLFGLPREGLIGRSVADFAAPGYDGEAAYRQFRTEGHSRGRFPLVRHDGTKRVLDFSAVADVSPGLSLSVLRDVTERVEAEDNLRQSEARFRVMIEKSADGIALTRADGTLSFQSAAVSRMLGYEPDEAGDRAAVDSALEEDRPYIVAQMGRLVRGEREITLEYRARHRDGSIRWIEAVGTNLLDDPDVGAIVGNFRDITDRKHFEEALAASEARYRRLIEDIPEPVFIQVDGMITFANGATARALGVPTRDALIGKPIEAFVPAEALSATNAELAERAELELSLTRPNDRREVRLEVRTSPILFDGKPAILGIARDITERARAARETERALRAQQQSLRLQRIAGRTARLGGWALDLLTSTLVWSDEVCAIHEVPDGYMPPLDTVAGFYSADHGPLLHQVGAECVNNGTPFDVELQLRTAKGNVRWVRCIGEPVRDASGQVVEIQGAFQDITDRRTVEASLRASEALFRTVIQSSWDVFHLIGSDGTILYESPSVERVLGYRPEEMIGRRALEFMHPEDRPTEEQMRAAQGGSALKILRIKHKDGSWRWVESFEVDLRAHADVGAIAVNYRDITERKEAENRLAETNRALRVLSRGNEALIRSTDEQDLLSTICRIAVDEGGFSGAWVGYARDDEEKPPASRACAGDDGGQLIDGMERFDSPAGRVLQSGAPVVIPDLAAETGLGSWAELARDRGVCGLVALPLNHADSTFGVLVLCSSNGRVLRFDDLQVLRDLAGNLAFGIVNLRSQVERRRLQTALQKVAASSSASAGAQFFEQLVSRMVEALDGSAGFMARLLPGHPARAQTVAAIVDGRALPSFDFAVDRTPCQELLDRDMSWVVPRTSGLFSGEPVLAALDAKAFVGWRLDDAAGRPTGLLFVLFREPLHSTEFVCSTIHIFATRAALELERQKADARLQQQASLLDTSQDAIIVRDLDHRVSYWNKSAERHYGWTAAEAIGRSALELIYGEDATEVEAATEATIEHGQWVGELAQRRKDGTALAVEGRWSLVRDDQGAPRSILAVNTDLSERKKLARVEEQLRQAQKMEAIGSLAGGVAHDFNNLLSVILSYSELAASDLSLTDPLRADLEEVKRAGLRASELTGQLLAFSRKQILQPVVLDLNQVIAGVQKMLLRLLGEHIELSILTSSGPSQVFADAGQLEQVVMNLVVNSRDAMPDGGALTIETSTATLDETYVAEHAGTRAGSYVLMAVTDTGSGMDRATQARIFEPFFTTKDKGKGTGLGLSTVYGIIQQSGGHVSVYSEVGHGTTFKVYLPRSDRALSKLSLEVAPKRSLRGTETVLIVEDEAQVRALLRTILRKNGYHVLEAQNGGEAFLIVEQFTATIHLMVTDLVMPRMSGRQLAERLSPLRPRMKVLFISGYTEDTIIHHGILDAGIDFLAKPIMPESLLTKVRSVLDRNDDAPGQ